MYSEFYQFYISAIFLQNILTDYNDMHWAPVGGKGRDISFPWGNNYSCYNLELSQFHCKGQHISVIFFFIRKNT